jgi:hypothetical protein
MIDNEPYFYDPKSGWTGWKKDGQWLMAMGGSGTWTGRP